MCKVQRSEVLGSEVLGSRLRCQQNFRVLACTSRASAQQAKFKVRITRIGSLTTRLSLSKSELIKVCLLQAKFDLSLPGGAFDPSRSAVSSGPNGSGRGFRRKLNGEP